MKKNGIVDVTCLSQYTICTYCIWWNKKFSIIPSEKLNTGTVREHFKSSFPVAAALFFHGQVDICVELPSTSCMSQMVDDTRI